MRYPYVPYAVAPSLHSASNHEEFFPWTVSISNTFVDIVCEGKPQLGQSWSTPGLFSGSEEKRDLLSTTGDSSKEDLELRVLTADIEPCACQHAEEPSPLSKTAKRNQRNRTQKRSVHTAPNDGTKSVEASNDGGSPTSRRGAAKASINGGSSASCQIAAEAVLDYEPASPSEKRNWRKKTQTNISRNAPQDGVSGGAAESVPAQSIISESMTDVAKQKQAVHHNVRSSIAEPSPKAEAELEESAAAWSWQGINPTDAERVHLKSKFLEIFHQEYKLGKETINYKCTKVMTPEELAKFNCKSSRLLVSVHGDIFDVTSNSKEYGPGGYLCFEAGTDISWAAVSGFHSQEHCNCFYDMFKATDERVLTGRFMNLCRTIATFQRDYGKPVGRLRTYVQERKLPPPPLSPTEDVCPVQ